MKLVLGSASPYKKQLLEQLGVEFTTVDPNIDEAALLQPTVEQSVRVIAEAKARALLPHYANTDTLIITADVAG